MANISGRALFPFYCLRFQSGKDKVKVKGKGKVKKKGQD
jgi:hypothetical protein